MNHKSGIILAAFLAVMPALQAAPVISEADRTVQFPQPSAPIRFDANITDSVAALSSVVLYVDTNYPTAPGTTAFSSYPMAVDAATTWTATVPAVADKTFVKWYIEATNANNETTRYPEGADSLNAFQVTSNPVDADDIVITELIADPNGSDGATNSEWFEIYNRSAQPVDLSYFFFGNYPTGPNARIVREGTIIPPDSYMVFAGNKTLFQSANPTVPEDAIYDIGWTVAVLPNGGGLTNNVFFAHANERNWQGVTRPFANVPYINGENGWPSWATTNSNTVSLQIANPALSMTDGLNWNMSSLATPGAPNRVITEAGPLQRYPTVNAPVAFEAVVGNWATDVKLFYRVGEGTFSSINFAAPSTGNTWTATIPVGFPSNTVVDWYVEATAPEGVVHYPFNALTTPLEFWVTTNVPAAGAVVINELVYDPQGGDNGAHSEWVELYNPGSSPVDLGGIIFGRNLTIGDSFERVFPSGTVIQPQGYMILAGNRASFGNIYSSVPSDIIFDLQWGTSSVFNNTAGNANLRYPGSNLREVPNYVDQVPYQSSSPWPVGANNNGGATIELINPVLDNSLPHNWRTSVGDIFAGANRGTPGYQNSTFTTDIDLAIRSVTRSVQYPTSGDAITISAQLEALNTVSSARLYVSTTAGGAFTPINMAGPGVTGVYTAGIGPFPSGTYVRYYVEATAGSTTKLLPEGAPGEFLVFLVEDGTPVTSADVAFNEIQADPQSTDNGASSEWVEIMNLRDTPIDLSYFVFSPKPVIGSDIVVIPEGTIVPPRGFLLIVGNKPLFESEYANSQFTFDPNLVIGAEGWESRSAITNGANTISFRHVNAWGYSGSEGNPIDVVAYNPDVIGTASNGLTAELIRPGIANDDNSNWAASLIKGGTPGAPNTQYRPVLMTIGRDKVFPGPTDTFVFTVKAVAADEASTVSSVTMYVSVNSSPYEPRTMTFNATTGLWESAALGPYPNGTPVSFYAVGTDSYGDSSAFPVSFSDHHFDLLITENGNHVEEGQVVINEILYDNVGSDAYEFIELYNTTQTPIDLSYFRVADNEFRPLVFPAGSVIPADGYMVLTMDDFIFRTRYGNPSGQLFSWNNQFNLANGGDVIRLVHPNEYRVDEVTTATEQVQYGTKAPWPFFAQTEDGPNVTGRSIELINPAMADRGTNGNAWAWTTAVVTTDPAVQGTPGRRNSVYNPTASVSDWTLY